MNAGKVTYYRAYKEEQMTRAVYLFKKKKWSKRKAAKLCGVPESSLRTHLKRKKGGKFETPMGKPSLIPNKEECSMKDHILHMADLGYPFSRQDVMRIGTQTAVFLKVKEDSDHILSKHWLSRFLSRWPELKAAIQAHRKRAKAVTEQSVSQYFGELKDIMVKYKFKEKPYLIFSFDETSLNLNQKSTKVVAPEGLAFDAVKTNKGAVATILAAGNAAGYAIPPYFIFKGKQLSDRLRAGAYPRSGFQMTSSGYCNGEVLMEYIENHFLKYLSTRDPDEHILLLYNSHSSDISINLINHAQSKKIILFVLPPHYKHLLLPLDGTFKPLKDFYQNECQAYLTDNPDLALTRNEICQLISKAYFKAFTPANLIASLKMSGIFTYTNITDEQIFQASKF